MPTMLHQDTRRGKNCRSLLAPVSVSHLASDAIFFVRPDLIPRYRTLRPLAESPQDEHARIIRAVFIQLPCERANSPVLHYYFGS